MKNRVMKILVIIPIVLLLTPIFSVMNTQLSVIDVNAPLSQDTLAEVDLNRVEWRTNIHPNPGFELWNDPHNPDEVNDYRTTEHYPFYAEAPYPVNEGSRSFGLQARAVDLLHPAEVSLRRQSWSYSPSYFPNLTIRLDWYIDELPDPTESDTLWLHFELGSPSSRDLYYYLGCTSTSVSNTSGRHYYFIEGAVQTWHTLSRNLTDDYFNAFSVYPTELEYFRVDLQSRTSEYSRAFLDDFRIMNGTDTIIGGAIGNGDFEASTFWLNWKADPADISQSSDAVEGDWSLNATTISRGNRSQASVNAYMHARLSSLNPDVFTFNWKIDDFLAASEDTYAYMTITGGNSTGEEFYVIYLFCYGGMSVPFEWPGAQFINVTGFNTTGQWHTFNRSIWKDVSSFNQTNEYILDEIEINVFASEYGARLSILFDNISITAAALNDMGYEDQGDVGDPIIGWDLYDSPDPMMTVTNLSYSGSKAANITAVGGDSYDGTQEFAYRLLNDRTDTWLDMYWKLENFTQLDDEVVYLEVYLDNDDNFAYIFSNGSNINVGNGFDKFILLPEINVNQTWHHFQRNLVDDYIALFGTEPDTILEGFYLYIESANDGRVEFLLDDMYLYNEPEPEILDILQLPETPDANEEVDVSVTVIDLSLDTVILHYKVDFGVWVNQTMQEATDDSFEATISGQSHESEVEYFISANDTFAQSASTSIYQYSALDTTSPMISITAPANESVVSGIVDIIYSASDSGSGIQRVEIYIQDALVYNTTEDSLEWNTTTLVDGNYTIRAVAFDVVGNSAETLHVVTVSNGVPAQPDNTLLIIMAIVGAVALVIVIVYLFVIKPKQSSGDS